MSRDWMKDAKCRGDDPDKYDLDIVKLRPSQKAVYAALLCKDCPVAAQCAAEVLRGQGSGTIRGGAVITSKLSDHARNQLQQAVLTGKVPQPNPAQIHTLKKAPGKRNTTTKDDARQKSWQLQRKMDRWDSRRCDECGVGVKPASLPDEIWPERGLTHDPMWRTHICRACGERQERQREEKAYAARTEAEQRMAEKPFVPSLTLTPDEDYTDTMHRWQGRMCRWCMALIRPKVLPDEIWPDRALAANGDTCIKCHEENTKIA
jgi:hypothetical protein